MTSNIHSDYIKHNPESERLFEEAKGCLPGGDTRSVTFNEPFPTFIESADGCRMTTVDEDVVIDFLNNYTQAIHGHAPPAVVEAITNRLEQGNGLGAPTSDVIELARRLVDRFPGIGTVRFTNSGTEATMNAIRAAMAHTERETVIKVRGGYHGSHDTVEIGVSGTGREHPGIPSEVDRRVTTVPYNDPGALRDAFETHGHDVACFIVEPILGAGGMIPAEQEYLDTARDVTEDWDALLIFDEVMSSRLATGGAQQRYGVEPDLTALGKYIGGGLPVGAVGGREDVMEVFDPTTGEVKHSGTFNGNPATMAGGIATLEALDAAAISRINTHGRTIRQRINAFAESEDLPVTVTGAGSLFHVHFTNDTVTDASAAERKSDTGADLALEFYFRMRSRDIFMAPRGMGNVSTPMSEREIDRYVGAAQRSLEEMFEDRR